MGRKFLALAALAALAITACGTAESEPVAESTPTPETASTPEPTPDSAYDCDWLSGEVTALSEEQADDDPLSAEILALYNVEPTEDNRDAYMAGTFTFEGNTGVILACEGDANFTSGGEVGLRMEWTIDVNGDEFVGYQENAAAASEPVTLPGVTTSVGARNDDYGITTVPVTVTNGGTEVLPSVWVTVRAENTTTLFGDGYLVAENLAPGQSYTDDVYIDFSGDIPADATFTVIEVSEY